MLVVRTLNTEKKLLSKKVFRDDYADFLGYLEETLRTNLEETLVVKLTRSPVKKRETQVREYLSTLGLEIIDDPNGYSLKKRGLPEFKVFTTQGTLVEKFFATGKKRFKWCGFLNLRDQKRINEWKNNRKNFINPDVKVLKYFYDSPVY